MLGAEPPTPELTQRKDKGRNKLTCSFLKRVFGGAAIAISIVKSV